MWWRRGWLFNSLNYQVEKNLRESLYENAAFQESSWGWWERQVLHWSGRPAYYILLVVVAFVLAIVLGMFWQDELRAIESIWMPESHEITNWVAPILGAQVTIIGLIFPLVVGFVGILLQDKSANRALWQIYSRYSGFMFTGLSGLALTGAIIASRYAHPWFSHYGEFVLAFSLSLWFLFNVILAGWFLHATFRFMATGHRSSLVLQYCINEVLVAEVSSRLSELLPGTASNLGLLGNVESGDNEPKISSIYFSRNDDHCHLIEFEQNRYLANIYFRGLQLVCVIWRLRASFTKQADFVPELVLPISGRTSAHKKWILAITRNGDFWPPLRWITRASYSFRKSPVINTAPIDQILDALVGNVEDALRADNMRQFTYALNELEAWHRDVLGAGAFTNDSGERDNWLLLRNRIGFGHSISDDLSSELFQINRAILQRLPQSTRYFERFCNYFIRIYGWRVDWLPAKVTKGLISGHYQIWNALMQWQQVGSQGTERLDRNPQYASTIKSYVGSWEAWPSRLEQYDGDWNAANRVVDPYIHHLCLTGRQIISAVRGDSADSSEWAVDMLNNWYGAVFLDGEPYRYGWHDQFMVHQMLGEPVDNPLWSIVLNNQEFSSHDTFRIAILNCWIDIRLSVAAYLMKRFSADISENLALLVNALLSGEGLKAGGSSPRAPSKINESKDVLHAYIRQRWYWEHGDGTYSSWLDGVLSTFAEMDQEKWVSGRVYSSSGEEGVGSLTHAYVAIAISLTRRRWFLSVEVEEFLFSEIVGLRHREQLIRDLREIWLEPSEAIVELARKLSGMDTIDEHLETYRQSIGSIIQQLEEQNLQEVIDAPIDEGRLIQFGQFASASAFAIENGPAPQSFFSDIKFVNELDDASRHSISVNGYERSNVSRNLDVNRSFNEDEWFDRMVVNAVSDKIFRDVFAKRDIVESRLDELNSLIDRIIQDSKSMVNTGLTPLLLVGPNEVSRALKNAMWPYSPQDYKLDYDLKKEEGHPGGYICHLEGIETYRLPFRDAEFCILIARESFGLMRVRRIDDGRYVDVEFHEYKDNQAKGDLRLTFWIESQLGQEAAFKYVFEPGSDADE